jgi:cytidylate kinase
LKKEALLTVITLSRQSGSSGNEVAHFLCEKLNYRLFDKTMMAQLAKELNDKAAGAEEISEHHQKTVLERILNPFDGIFEAGHVAQRDISLAEDSMLSISQVRDLIKAAYDHGNVVIVGRGSQVVLAGLPDVLHVRIVASYQTRVKTWQQRKNLSYKEAQKVVRERDRAHVDFVKNFFDTDLRDATLYDLVINTNKLSPLSAAELIIQALQHIEPPG